MVMVRSESQWFKPTTCCSTSLMPGAELICWTAGAAVGCEVGDIIWTTVVAVRCGAELIVWTSGVTVCCGAKVIVWTAGVAVELQFLS